MASREELIAQKEKTSQALIEAALELCANEGFASLSLRSVARKAGIAPTSFYRHFRDIDELGISMALAAKIELDICMALVREQCRTISPPENDSPDELKRITADFVQSIVGTMMSCFETHTHLLRLFFQEKTGSSPAMRETISNEADQLIDYLAEDLSALSRLAAKPLGDIRLLAETMLTIISADGMEKMVGAEKSDAEIFNALQHKLCLLLFGALACGASAQSTSNRE